MNRKRFLDKLPKWEDFEELVVLISLSALIVGFAALSIGDERGADICFRMFGISLVVIVLMILYDTFFQPWRMIERGIHEIEKQLELLNGRFARLHAFIIAPWLKEDLEKTKEFLRMRKSLKQRELAIYTLLRR